MSEVTPPPKKAALPYKKWKHPDCVDFPEIRYTAPQPIGDTGNDCRVCGQWISAGSLANRRVANYKAAPSDEEAGGRGGHAVGRVRRSTKPDS